MMRATSRLLTSRLDAATRRRPAFARTLGGFVMCMVLTGCDQLGIETPQKAHERVEAEARAIGSACRHALRAIEDCYTLNPKADKSAVFGGWREMDEYMRENKLEGVAPVVPRQPLAPAAPASAPSAEEDEDEEIIEDAPPKRSGKR